MVRGIDKSAIVSAALDVLDVDGIDGVTVRAVAGRLGVQAPALYYHVRNKQDLLDEMGTEIHRRLIGTLATYPQDGSWLDDLTAYGSELRLEYLAHRDGARTFSGTLITDPAVLAAQEPWLQRWTAAGVSLPESVDAFDIVTALVVGFVIEEQERESSDGGAGRYAPDDRAARIGDDFPLAAASSHARGAADDRFHRHLHVVIGGLSAAHKRYASGAES